MGVNKGVNEGVNWCVEGACRSISSKKFTWAGTASLTNPLIVAMSQRNSASTLGYCTCRIRKGGQTQGEVIYAWNAANWGTACVWLGAWSEV